MHGVIVGADISQEWLLPWWWHHYQKHNTHPVAFFDFGMSFTKKQWCQERGTLIPLRMANFAKEKAEMAADSIEKLEKNFGSHFWDSRGAWFKKPFACLKSPFQKTIWIDLDCEVRAAVDGLFQGKELSMALDRFSLKKEKYPSFNSGVIAFRQNEPLVVEWAQFSLSHNHLFRGDDEVFSWMTDNKGYEIPVLDPKWNWSRLLGESEKALIFHWHGPMGKFVIRHAIEKLQEILF